LLNTFKLKTPLSEANVRTLKVGDIVYLNGEKVYVVAMASTARYLIDRIEKGNPLFNLEGSVIYQCPIGVRKMNEQYKVRWVGATTSIMSEEVAPKLIQHGARAIMGKGGMGEKTLDALKKYGGVYLATVGATSSILARHVVRIVNMYDPTLTFPLCELEVKNFGRLIVGMDSHGRSLFDHVWQQARKKVAEILSPYARALCSPKHPKPYFRVKNRTSGKLKN